MVGLVKGSRWDWTVSVNNLRECHERSKGEDFWWPWHVFRTGDSAALAKLVGQNPLAKLVANDPLPDDPVNQDVPVLPERVLRIACSELRRCPPTLPDTGVRRGLAHDFERALLTQAGRSESDGDANLEIEKRAKHVLFDYADCATLVD
jgi:hypothetical protein